TFPLKLWQKTGPKGLTPISESYISTWTTLNPTLRHEILSDASSAAYVDSAYKETWPSIASLYHSIQVPIVKADLLRLLILYADGGIWSDLDVGCELSIHNWGVLGLGEATKNEIDMIVGLEFDGWQFASWTVLSRAGSMHMKAAIEYVAGQLEGIAERNNVTVDGVTMEMIPDVVDASGPQALTLAVLGSLSRGLGERVGRENITGVREPRLLGDVLVLPQAAFAARQGGYPTDQGPYLVSHHYAGSWKNENGGE
ncbi:glycosyltransferase family 32 protein, partial [Aspergillus carbonarius ITEM 5010]